jgi:hypothetical protein
VSVFWRLAIQYFGDLMERIGPSGDSDGTPWILRIVAVLGVSVATGCVAVVLVFFVGVVLSVRENRAARQAARPDFEVKLTTGQTPVLLKKEVDHG